jgi:hypothetical protein
VTPPPTHVVLVCAAQVTKTEAARRLLEACRHRPSVVVAAFFSALPKAHSSLEAV